MFVVVYYSVKITSNNHFDFPAIPRANFFRDLLCFVAPSRSGSFLSPVDLSHSEILTPCASNFALLEWKNLCWARLLYGILCLFQFWSDLYVIGCIKLRLKFGS